MTAWPRKRKVRPFLRPVKTLKSGKRRFHQEMTLSPPCRVRVSTMFPQRKFNGVFWTTENVSEPVAWRPRWTVSHCLWAFQATHVDASCELAAWWSTLRRSSSRFRATDFFCHNVGVVLLHPGAGGHRLEALSMSAPWNSVAASPEIMGVTSSMSSVSTSCPTSPTRVPFFLPLGGVALPKNLTECSAQRRPGRCRPDPAGPASTAGHRHHGMCEW